MRIICIMVAGLGLASAACTEQSAPTQEADTPATEYRGTYQPGQSVASTPTGSLDSAEGFRAMDRDGDGSISLTELQLLDNDLSELDFQRFDADDSKSLNLAEFGAWRTAASSAPGSAASGSAAQGNQVSGPDANPPAGEESSPPEDAGRTPSPPEQP